MGLYMIGTWLYTLISVGVFGFWSMYSLSQEGWISSRGSWEKSLRVILWVGIAYEILLPFYWCFVLSPKGIPYDFS